MLRWIVLAAVVVVLAGVAAVVSEYAPNADSLPSFAVDNVAGPKPKVEVPEPLIHEFGSMAQLSEGTHSWEFKNIGDAELELWMESSTCSCTIAKLSSKEGEEKKKVVVKPKDSTKIDLQWQTKMFHDEYSKGATIGTNDPSRRSITLNVKGKVFPPVIVFPNEMITFNAVSNEEPHQAKIAVFSVDRADLKIKKISTSRPEFLVPQFRPLSPEECKQLKVKGGLEVTVEMKPGMPLGRFQDELAIETDHPLKSDVKVTIAGNTTGPISAIPDRVRMPGVSSSQGASRDSTLLVRGERPTTFTVAYHPEKVKVEVTPDDTPTQKGRYKMSVIVPPGTAAGPIEDIIILKTDHPKAGEIKIPVSILISNAGAG
jgi:Protein of unknown function (DUF1573)